MAIDTHLHPTNSVFPCSVPQLLLHHSERQVDRNMPNARLLSDSNGYCYCYNATANNEYNNQPITPPVSHSLTAEFDEQSNELDQFIRSESEKLRIMMQEQRRQQVASLLRKVESYVLYVLSQKDEQIAEAAMKRVELEEFLTRLEAENQSWRSVAQENEAMVLSLHNALEQIKERASYSYCFNNGVAAEDAESCCDENMRNLPGGVGGAEQITTQTIVCKCCRLRNSCFMFLPCRHLCSCKPCEAFLQACPVCRMPKKSSIETLIF